MADSEGSNSSSEMSEDFQERLSELKAKWKAALKRNKKLLLKCPNYSRCQFKCGSVGGMHYHFVRCAGNAPQFKCHQCSRQYESRTGLNYHMASSHGNEPIDDLKSDNPSSRPQRSATITTLTAIHISNNPPPLKQHLPPQKTTTKTPPTSNKTTPTTNKTPPTTNKTPLIAGIQQPEEPKPVAVTKRVATLTPPPSLSAEEQPIKMSKKAQTPPTSKHAGTKRVKGEGGSRQKKNKYVTIPSIEYPDEYKSFLPMWRQEMKDNKIIKCPNFEECEFKCTTVNGMKYHYVRCMKSNPPEFNCELCDKKFQCRTGLVWHLKKTHKLIDIQPSKTGGFKGTIPTDALKMSGVDEILGLASSSPLGTVIPAAAVVTVNANAACSVGVGVGVGGGSPSVGRPGRKKIKLEQKGSVLLGKTRMLLSHSGRKSDGSRYQARKRLRKSTSPRRTSYNILQNVLLKRSSKPNLGPQTKKLHLPMVEFIITDDISTDIDPRPSAIIQLGEEALQWQKMYSDSEGESDYNPDGEETSRQFEIQSNSSASDSDEDYTWSFSTAKKKKGPKPGTKYAERMTGGRGGGVPRKGRGGKVVEPKEVPMLVRPPEDVPSYLIQPPPPLLVKRDKQDELFQSRASRAQPPALIKTSKINTQSNHDVNEEFDRLTNVGVVTSQVNNSGISEMATASAHNIQPPPSLVMPTPQLREPPPLVKKEEGVSPSTAFYPHIVLPLATNEQPVSSYSSKRSTHPPSEGAGMVQSSTTPPPPPPAPAPRRPGRPRKDQGNTSQGGLKTSSKTVRLGSAKAHYKPSKGSKGQASSYSVKGMKMTQYEFQSVSMAQHLTTPTLSTSHKHAPPSQQQQQQQQHVVLAQPGNTAGAVQVPNIQNVVAPLQVFPAASLHYPSNIGGMPSGSVLYVQGAPQGVTLAAPQGNEMSTYIAQDGNAYQLVQANPAQDNAQKVSVIMHPGPTGGAGGIQYITQLDGPPPKVSKTAGSSSSKDLREKFEEARRIEREKLEGTTSQQKMDTEVVRTSGTGSSSSKVAVSVSEGLSNLSIGMESCYQIHSGSSSGMGTRRENTDVKRNTSPEELMSVQLKSYFKMEQARKAKCVSPPSSGRSRDAVNTFNVATSTSAPNLGASCLSERKKKRISSKSVSREEETTSPTKAGVKSPRLVVSPTLFSPTYSSGKTGDQLSRPVSSCESVANVKTGSTRTAKGRRQLARSVKPDSQNLFFPDKILTTILPLQKTTTTTTTSTSYKKLLETSNKPVEFSPMLHTSSSSSLKRPTPIHHKDTRHILEHNSNHSNSNETTTAAVSSSDSENSSSKEDADSSSSSKATTPDDSPAPSLETTPTKQSMPLEVQPSCLRLGKHSHSDPTEAITQQLGECSGTFESDDVPATPTAKVRRKYATRKSIQSSEHGSLSSKTEQQSPGTPPPAKRKGRGMSRLAPPQTPPERTTIATPTSTSGVEPMDTNEEVPVGGSVRKTPARRGRPRKNPMSAEKNIFNCPKCDKQYTTQPGLKAHMKTAHADTGLTAESSYAECLTVWKQLFKQQKSVVCVKCGTHKANSVSAMRYHWQKCGKSRDEVAVSCPHCLKTYQSKAGLAYHLNVQHTVKPDPEEEPAPLQHHQSPSPTPSPRDVFTPLPTRRAAKRAAKKLTEFVIKEPTASGDADSADIPMDVAPSGLLEKEGTAVGSLSEAQLVQLKAELAKDGTMKCPIENCEKRFKSLPGLKYHIRGHEDIKKQLQCPLCMKLIQSRKRMENHLRSKHPAYQLENLDDLEYTPPVAAAEEEESEGSDLEDDVVQEGEDDDEEEEKEQPKPSSKSKSSSGTMISSYSIPRTFKEYEVFVAKLLKRLYSENEVWELQGKEWQARVTDWTRVSGSELSACLPKATTSVKFVFSSSDSSLVGNGQEFSLPLFGSTGKDFPVTTVFAGGPVWAMDWLPVNDVTDEQFVALSAYGELDERHPTEGQFSHQSLIQLWSMGHLVNSKDCSDTCTPKLSLGIAHNFGFVRAMKWYPHCISSTADDYGGRENPVRLGVLAISCSDGYVRIISIPELKSLTAALSTKKKRSPVKHHLPALSDETLFVKLKREAALLMPNGMGTTDNSVFGQCLCLDWLPGNKYTRIAAGFSNGSVCVWDFSSSFLRTSDSKSGTLIIHPLSQLSAHTAPCRCVAWCPHNHNYLFTGGYDKIVALWDLRQPFSPIEKQERSSNVVYEAIWPLLWCSVICILDTSVGLQPNNSLFYMSYLHSQPGFRNQKAITSSSAPLCTESYSIWTDRVVAGSYGGEMSLVTFPTSFHVTAAPKSIMHSHKMFYSCRMEPLIPAAAAAAGSDGGDGESIEPSLEVRSKETAGSDNRRSKVSKKQRTKVKSEDSGQVSSQSTDGAATIPAGASVPHRGEGLSMEELAKSHRLVFRDHQSNKAPSLSYDTEVLPLQAVTKVCWNPTKESCNWLLLGTNSGLVQLLHVAPPSRKPLSR